MPPRPGQAGAPRRRRCAATQALFFDGMERKVADRPLARRRAGLRATSTSSTARAARTSTSPASPASPRRRPTRPSCCTPVPLRRARRRGREHARARLQRQGRGPAVPRPAQRAARRRGARSATRKLGLPAEPFASVQLLAPVRRGSRSGCPRTGSRGGGRRRPSSGRCASSVDERLLRFLFAEADDAASQLSFVVDRVEAQARGRGGGEGRSPATRGSRSTGARIDDVRRAGRRPQRSPTATRAWPSAGRARGAGHRRRLRAPAARAPRRHVGHLIRGRDVGRREDAPPRLEADAAHRRSTSTRLHDRAKRFVVGVVLKRMFEEKEALGTRAAAGVRRARRAQQVRPARGQRPDQGGPARHLRARPQPRHRARSARSRRRARWSAASSPTPRCASSAGSTPPRPSGPSTASSPPPGRGAGRDPEARHA